MKKIALVTLAVATLLWFSCARRQVLLPPWPTFEAPQAVTPQAIADAFDHRQPQWDLLQAKIRLKISRPNEKVPTLSGDLFLKKPNSVRLRAYNPLGAVAFDLLYHAGNVELYLPHRREVVVVPVDQLDTLEFGGKSLSLPSVQDWWRVIQPWPGSSAYEITPFELLAGENENEGVLFCEADRFFFDWRNGRIHKVTLKETAEFRYSNWKFLKGQEYPERVDIARNEHEETLAFRLQIVFEKIQSRESFAQEVFQPVNKENIQVTRLQ